ncbi:helix-turn-helix transcriptional regulator [Nonomuraea sp. NPDC001831]|uniref:helix-turn-helix transcriptional regulator n=1 Tax=Nonomuraea sp. NPDC001831 TaxID=3364340 RepID=UPI0036B5DACF
MGQFLRSRRARIHPADAGLPASGRRRVSGLRREEVALLAGVSVDYYIRLEQERVQNVSDAVLDAVARVLRMDDTERAHLRDLLRPARHVSRPVLRPGLSRLLDLADGMPAFVLGPRMDVLAWNTLADRVSGFAGVPDGRRNQLLQVFLAPHTRTLYPDWAEVAADTVAYLRLYAGRHPEDPLLAELVAELSADPDFVRLWAEHGVAEKTYGTKRLRHPELGELEFGYETLAVPGQPDLVIVMYTADPDSDTGRVVARLREEIGSARELARSGRG